MNYEEDVRIDDTALDVEWLDQSSLAMRYGKYYAKCRKRLTQAEEKIKVIRAELIKKANEDPMKCCKKEKPNAADIEAYYRNDSRHKEAKDEWIQAQYELDIAEVAKNEISFTRKSALENMVRLYIAGYFAGPKIPRDLHNEVLKRSRQDEADDVVSSKMTRSR
jgi:hypothetical protein